MSPTKGFARVMAARRRRALAEARDRAVMEGYETEERYQVAQDKQDAEASVDRMVDGAIERAMLGD